MGSYCDYISIDPALIQTRFGISAGDLSSLSELKLGKFWIFNPLIYRILKAADGPESARTGLRDYLNNQELWIEDPNNKLHPLEKANVRVCIHTLKNIISANSEKLAGVRSLNYLYDLAHENLDPESAGFSTGFFLEFIHLFKGVAGLSGIYAEDGIAKEEIPDFIGKSGLEAATIRSEILDNEESVIELVSANYPFGLQPEIIKDRERNKARILSHFGAEERDWQDYHWHIRNVIRDADTLRSLIDLTDEEEQAIRLANENHIPFGITPYYASLMDKNPSRERDYSIRNQVIPPLHYSVLMSAHKDDRSDAFDFMGEHSTSPAPLITRRYPQVAVFKPYHTCAQICVYCQRNWEIDEVLAPGAMATQEKIDAAIQWLSEHSAIQDVLITGGDPLIMPDEKLNPILERVARIAHIQRIRIATRTPVVLPFRFTDETVKMLASYDVPGKQEVVVVTHFENVMEVTPDTVEAITKLRREGISICNQTVFTFANSRRFEMVALRRQLKLIGVDPYYLFNTKGKEETIDYRVPIARLLQERKEEARLMPGIDRSDEPVFNVPRIGKNHLRAGQDRRVIMIRPDGRRIYEFLPWEKNLMAVPPYIYTDVPIWRYLEMLRERGENISDYKNVWYYY